MVAEIDIVDPSLVVLIGAAGAGKSTFAAHHFTDDEVLSSDRFRALVSGDEADQSATHAAFGRLHRELARRLEAGRFTVVDATSLEPSSRRALLARAVAAGVPATAIVFDLPAETVLAAVCLQTIGRRLPYTNEDLQRILSPRHFVEVRRTFGGPAPEETLRALGVSEALLDEDHAWLTLRREALTSADRRRHERAVAL